MPVVFSGTKPRCELNPARVGCCRTRKFERALQEMLILVMALYVHSFGADSFIRLTELTLSYSAELAA